MNKILKNIVLCVLAAGGLIFAGTKTLDIKTTVEEKQSSYTLTDFDYLLVQPSKDQVTQFRSETDAVKTIFPCYQFEPKINVTSGSSSGVSTKINLLLSDDMKDYSVSLFNDATLVSGEFSSSGMMLDKTAADKLGVSVGDKVSVTLAMVSFEFNVSAIYMASTYHSYESGLALASYSTAISDAYGKELQYDVAFVDAVDQSKCAKLFENYVPMGGLQSEEDYTADYKSRNTLPPNTTEEEWNASIHVAYEEMKSAYLSQKFTGVVQNKADYMDDVKEQVKSTEKKINYLCIVAAAAVIILYVLLSLVFIRSNSKDDQKLIKLGKKHIFRPYYLVVAIGAIAVALATGTGLMIYGMASKFAASFAVIILAYSLPVLVSIPLAFLFIRKYERKLCLNTKAKKPTGIKDGNAENKDDNASAETSDSEKGQENTSSDSENKDQ